MQDDTGGKEHQVAAAGTAPAAASDAGNSRSSSSTSALSAQELQTVFLLGQEHGGELTQDLLQTQGWQKEKIVAAFNRLTGARAGIIRRGNANGRVVGGDARRCTLINVDILLGRREEDISCALRPTNIIGKLKTLDAFDYKIYCAIEQAGSTGVWTADLRKSTGLQTHVIQRSVKQLCDVLKLIKPVKSIHVKNRKMYILSHLEPSKEIAGGAFYSNGEFNEPLVDHLREQACVFLQSAGTASFQALAAYTRSSGELSGATFSDEDLEKVLSSLEYEQKVTKIITPQQIVYTWSRFPDLYDGTALPCSRCQLKHLCCRGPDNPISPTNCEYYTYWLGLDFEVKGEGAVEEVAELNCGEEDD